MATQRKEKNVYIYIRPNKKGARINDSKQKHNSMYHHYKLNEGRVLNLLYENHKASTREPQDLILRNQTMLELCNCGTHMFDHFATLINNHSKRPLSFTPLQLSRKSHAGPGHLLTLQYSNIRPQKRKCNHKLQI